MNDIKQKENLQFLKEFIKSLDDKNKVFKLSSELLNIKEKPNDKSNDVKSLKKNN